jgi:hypothetical protein
VRTVPSELAGIVPQELYYELEGVVDELVVALGLEIPALGVWFWALSVLNARKLIEHKSRVCEGG